MSEDAPDLDALMLARLAELDMLAVEHVHAQLLDATDPDTVADLGRTYQRMARSLRQTLALKSKIARDRAVVRAEAALQKRVNDPVVAGYFADDRTMELQDAMERIAEAARPEDDDRARDMLLGRFDQELDDWACEPGYADADLDTQLRRACRLLDLPEDLIPIWRTLPRRIYAEQRAAEDTPADTTEGDIAEAPPPPWSSSA